MSLAQSKIPTNLVLTNASG